MIKAENISKRYGNKTAVDNISFEVKKGEIYGFLGPNGSGKSTTLNMITGYLFPDSGKIYIDSYDMSSEAVKAKQRIGYLPEIPPLYQDMTVREYLSFSANLKGVPRKERKDAIAEAMEKTNIADMDKKLIRSLSKGYKQRVGLSHALLGSPPALILDESAVGLDPKQTMEFRSLIKSFGRDHAIILSSHILSEISEICDNIMILSEGRIVANGKPDTLAGQSNRKELLISVRAHKKRAVSILNALCEDQQLFSFDILPAAENSTTDILIYPGENAEVRDCLFRGFAKEDCPIIQMKFNNCHLEDIFLQLTLNGNKEKGW